ncbi:MAG: outer membrane protein assembly factor BamD [Chlorobiaceae bacterium]|jgi:hypothetical protein|nr:outer membrane protein assembly factor BamD [Chlorobiaceae bacterium]
MVKISLFIFCFALSASMTARFNEYRLMQKGNRLYTENAYTKAETVFRDLTSKFPSGYETRKARYNLAHTLFMQQRFTEAGNLYARVSKIVPSGSKLHHAAQYNEGNSLAQQAFNSINKEEKKRFLTLAIDRYSSVLLSHPEDTDAIINYEVVFNALRKLRKPEESSADADKKSGNQGTTSISNSVATQLLDKTRADETRLMQQLAVRKSRQQHTGTTNQDW